MQCAFKRRDVYVKLIQMIQYESRRAGVRVVRAEARRAFVELWLSATATQGLPLYAHYTH